jgi:energy-coupling factor transporter ATP-binding protein EcfA2
MCRCIIVISGKKGSGKDTLANMIAAGIYNRKYGPEWGEAGVGDDGELRKWGRQTPHGASAGRMVSIRHMVGSEEQMKSFNARILSFATPLKQFCMDVLGLSLKSCYGTNAEKEMPTHVKWDGLPRWVRAKYASGGFYSGNLFHWLLSNVKILGWLCPRTGRMTGREVLQIFGTEIIRAWYNDAWAIAAYKAAAEAQEDFIFIPDCRFTNEVERKDTVPLTIPVIQIRLLRNKYPKDKHPSETSLDKYPISRFSYSLPEDVTLVDMRAFADTLARDVMKYHTV